MGSEDSPGDPSGRVVDLLFIMIASLGYLGRVTFTFIYQPMRISDPPGPVPEQRMF